jgi:hypothetical protein
MADPRPRLQMTHHSMFDMEWAGVAVDEAHELRTRNVKYEAMKTLREKAHSMVLATATPLFTGTAVGGFLGLGWDYSLITDLIA